MSEKTEKKPDGYVAFDLDGTLAEYTGWKGVEHIGEPIKPMIGLVKQYLAAGMEVKIFTARVAREFDLTEGAAPEDIKEAEIARTAIVEWCEQHIGQALPITCSKDLRMVVLYDDRCIQVEPNTGVILVDYYRAAADTMNEQLEEIRKALGVAQQKHIMDEIRRLVK
jgi:hypothetical protein